MFSVISRVFFNFNNNYLHIKIFRDVKDKDGYMRNLKNTNHVIQMFRLNQNSFLKHLKNWGKTNS